MKAVLRNKNYIYVFEQDTIVDGEYYLNKDLGIDRELFTIGREGYKLIKTNNPLYPQVDGLESEADEYFKKYPEGLTQYFDDPAQLKKRIDTLRTTIEGLIDEERQVAREFETILDELLNEGKEEDALKLVENVFANHKIFLSYFKKKIKKN